jgi:CBS domain-containing protein
MGKSIYSIKKVHQNDIDYLNVDLTEGVEGDSFSFKLKDGHPITDDFIENFELSYMAWHSLDADTRMPWSQSLVDDLIRQVSKFNNYQHYISDISISDIMTAKPKTFSPETLVMDAAKVIIETKISGAPVVDGDNVLKGIISEKDILASLFEENGKSDESSSLEIKSMSQTVDKIMTTPVLSISIDDEITPALRIMQDNNLRRVPVVKDSKLIGIVSIGDIHRAIFKSCLD